MNTRLVSELLEYDPENSGDSTDTKIASTSTPRRRGSIHKRVVNIPIKDVEGSRMKGDNHHMTTAPPSDSWAWRKYGQKPIKGSPYPRGYYRCSSSRGCPARKQVERSRMDPNMLVVTYSCEHNHPSRHNNGNHHKSKPTTSASDELEQHDQDHEEEKKPNSSLSKETIPDDKSTSLCYHEFEWWFPDHFDSTFCTMLESSISTLDRIAGEGEKAVIFTMQAEDESLYADLGELPECSTVFSHWEADDIMCLPQICLPS